MIIKNKVSAKLTCTFCALFTLLLLSNCKKDDEILTDNLTAKSLKKAAVEKSEENADFYKIEDALPEGYVKDGSKDYTSYLQAAINRYSKILFPDFPIMVNDKGLNIPSNRTIYFKEGSVLKLKPTSKASYDIIRIANVSNVTLAGPYIVGDRYSHIGTRGEWGNGIGIYGSKDINISKAKVFNCWGDGIYVGKFRKTIGNKNIRLFKPYCQSNRRDGITIIDADGLEMISPYIGFTDGTAPFCGINIEPNDNSDEIKNILIKNPKTENNTGNGIQVGLGNLYGKDDKFVDITIENHTDLGSSKAILASCRIGKKNNKEAIIGSLTINGADWQKNSQEPLSAYFPEKNMKLLISNPRVMAEGGRYLSQGECEDILTHKKAIWRPTDYTLKF